MLPQASEIDHHPLKEFNKDPKDLIITLRENDENGVFEDILHSPSDGSLTFVIVETLVLIVTGSAVAFTAWLITRVQVNEHFLLYER